MKKFLLIVLILKYIVITLLKRQGKTSKNELLIESYKESRADFISTCVVILVLIISFFEKRSFCLYTHLFLIHREKGRQMHVGLNNEERPADLLFCRYLCGLV